MEAAFILQQNEMAIVSSHRRRRQHEVISIDPGY
jgi:hypothetical protein